MTNTKIVGKEYFIPALELLHDELLSVANCVFVVGSFAEGLQSSTSDIDFYVTTNESYTGAFFKTNGAQNLDGRQVEVTVISQDKLNTIETRYLSKSYASFDPRELEYIHKICNAFIVHGAEAGALLKQKFAKATFCSNMVKYYLDYLADIYQDYIGAIDEGDIISAIGFANFMTEMAADAWLAKCGDSYPKSKWRGKRINNLSSLHEEIVEHYQRHVYRQDYDRLAQSDSYFQFTFDLIRRLNCATYFSIAPSEHSTPSLDKISLNLPLFITYSAEGFYCKDRGRVFSVDTLSGAILLCFYEPRTVSGIVEQVKTMLNIDGAGTDWVQQIVGRLEVMLRAGWLKSDTIINKT